MRTNKLIIMIKKVRLILAMCSLACIFTANAQTVDPYHTQNGGYGYRISESLDAAVWWSEATYKVMQDAPVPQTKKSVVSLE